MLLPPGCCERMPEPSFLYYSRSLAPGEELIVLGAGGGVGSAAVQLGAVMGATVTAVASTPERIALVSNYLASIGLSMVSLRTRASLEERYLALISEERSDAPS